MVIQDICIIFALAFKKNRSHDHLTIHRGVEQLAARRAHNPEVGGSSPPPATTTDNFGCPFFSFHTYLQALLLCSQCATRMRGNVCKHTNHTSPHHTTYGGTLASATSTNRIACSTAYIIGGCADKCVFIVRAIRPPSYGIRASSDCVRPSSPQSHLQSTQTLL